MRKGPRPFTQDEWVTRIFSSVVRLGDCLLYVGKDNGRGYQVIGGRRRVYAHRFVHEVFIGPIPAGYQVDHLCFQRACVNPAHLEAVTAAENLRRARERNGPPPRQPIRHGTTSSYSRLGCRCDECRRANTEAQRRWKARKRSGLVGTSA